MSPATAAPVATRAARRTYATALCLAAATISLATATTSTASGATTTYTVERDVSYDLGPPNTAPPRLNTLDIYMPARRLSKRRLPVVVWIHGGGWRKGDKRTGVRKKAEHFLREGYLFAAVNYRLSDAPFDPDMPDPRRTMFPAHPEDVGEAVTWLQQHAAAFGGDPARLILVGHSAGAHLAALVSTDPRWVAAHGGDADAIAGFVSLDAPAFDIATAADPELSQRPRESRLMLWNAFGVPAENASSENWTAASPLAFADPADPRGLLVTQIGAEPRRSENEAMARALGRNPLRAVLPLALDHREINRSLGARPDRSGETAAVSRFVRGTFRSATGCRPCP